MTGAVLRPETLDDVEFLKALYASSLEREMALLVGWTDEQKREFLEQQFIAQRSYYRQHYPDARYDVIELDGRRIGRLYVADLRRQLVLMDITLLPESRGTGLGTQFCKDLQAEARLKGKILTLHVEDDNPARRLYDRMGFVEIAAVTFYKLMHWVPDGLQQVSDELAAEVRSRVS